MLQGLDPVLEGIVTDLDKVTDFSGMIQLGKRSHPLYDDDGLPQAPLLGSPFLDAPLSGSPYLDAPLPDTAPGESTYDIISTIKGQLESASKNTSEAKAAKKAAEEAGTLEDLQKKYAKKQEEEKKIEEKKTAIDVESDEKVKEAEAEAKKKVANAEAAAQK